MKILHAILISMIICFIYQQESFSNQLEFKSQDKIPVLDKEKNYPKEAPEIKAEEHFIRLETRKDILLGQDAHIYCVSNDRILIVNPEHGDVFIFDMKGKALFHFNQKGGMGYVFIKYALYDEANKEVFIVDESNRKIFVFTEEGTLKRTLHFPSSTDITEIYSFDNTSLLAFHEHQFGPVTQKQPYMFISKKDGKILSKLNITTNKANSRTIVTDKGWITNSNNHMGNCKFGQEFILSNMSCDTIYLLKQDKTLTPLFVQSPSVFSDSPLIASVGQVTDDFVLFNIYSYDLKASARGDNNRNNKMKQLLYEFKTDKFFEIKKLNFWAEKVDITQNTSVEMLYPFVLKEWLKRGYLNGKWKEIATKVDVNDNPVVRLVKIQKIK